MGVLAFVVARPYAITICLTNAQLRGMIFAKVTRSVLDIVNLGEKGGKMRSTVVILCVLVLILSACATKPPVGAISRAATPKFIGSESGDTGVGEPGVHEWTDDDARTALWLRTNFPENISEIPFPIIKLFSYNQHHYLPQYMPYFEWSYYFADIKDPELLVRMLSIEARDRNRTRHGEVLAEEAARKAAAEKPIGENVSDLSDAEVSQKLEIVFP
jgi:hypothetical protein